VIIGTALRVRVGMRAAVPILMTNATNPRGDETMTTYRITYSADTHEVVRRQDGMTIHTGNRADCLTYAARSVVPRAGLVVRPLLPE